jgi:hypothetical protein
MSAAKDCPACGLVNVHEAQRCDCGYDFAARRHVGTLLPAVDHPSRDTGSLLVLSTLLAGSGAVLGAAVGIPVGVWAHGPGPDGCGLWVLPVMLEGATFGAALGSIAGGAAAACLLRHRA